MTENKNRSDFASTPTMQALVAEHRSWLAQFDAGYLANWENLLTSNPEGALAEAAIRRWLASEGIEVEPNEDLTFQERRPDFRCHLDGYKFYAEVTCLSVAEATKHSGLVDGQDGFQVYGPVTDKIFGVCRKKASQLGNLDAPGVVAYFTWHSGVLVSCFGECGISELLTGESSIALRFHPEEGRAVGDPYQSTSFRSAAFLRSDPEDAWAACRQTVSAILLCGPYNGDLKVTGALHPQPVLPFDPDALTNVPFAYLGAGPKSKKFTINWKNNRTD